MRVQLFRLIKARQWSTVFGYAFFIGMMSTGYYYNITLVQLGLVDLGTRLVGLSEPDVAAAMALLAVLTCITALASAVLLQRSGWATRFVVKLRLIFVVVCVQIFLTAVVPSVSVPVAFLTWIIFASLALGLGVPVTFSLTVDLIPVRDRGLVAGVIAGATYLVAAVASGNWTIDEFAVELLPVMLIGVLVVGVLAFRPLPLVARLAEQHRDPSFAVGRFAPFGPARQRSLSRHMIGFLVLMFGVFFIDSLGFLRIIATPLYVDSAWQSVEMGRHIFIGVTHLVAALVAGVLYSALDAKALFFWIFGIFALTHLMYAWPSALPTSDELPLVMPMFYAMAVSLYTVVNFALWADFSTPGTAALNTAVGVAVSGWAATFLSTAISMQWQVEGMPVNDHLRIVESLAMLFFLVMLMLSFVPLPSDLRKSENAKRTGR